MRTKPLNSNSMDLIMENWRDFNLQGEQLKALDEECSSFYKLYERYQLIEEGEEPEITPEEEDNCEQQSASIGRSSAGMPKNVDFQESPLSKRYTKAPTTMKSLRAAKRLIEK